MVRIRAIHTISALLILTVFAVSMLLAQMDVHNLLYAAIFSFMNIIGATFPPVGDLVDAQNPFVITSLVISIIGNIAFTIMFTTIFYQVLSEISITEWIAKQRARSMRNHAIITPINELGTDLAEILMKNKVGVVLVDNDKQRVREAARKGLVAIRGDMVKKEALQRAGVDRAFVLYALSDDDISNTFTTITSVGLDSRCKVVARAKRLEDVPRLRRAGARHVIMPESAVGIELGQHIVSQM